jgi:hypothetical protein
LSKMDEYGSENFKIDALFQNFSRMTSRSLKNSERFNE